MLQVSAEKKTLKLLKTYSVTVNWYVWLVGVYLVIGQCICKC